MKVEGMVALFFGTNLTDVLITGGNGILNGQGQYWWDKFRADKLKDTRPYLIEIMYSDQVQISNLTLIDSPSWNVHPTYSRFPLFSLYSSFGIYILSESYS